MGIGNIADTGMQAAMSNMETISNNIANANTIGYKRSYISFADIYPSANGSSGNQIGLGVSIAAVGQDFGRGGSLSTGRPLDLSIPNNGFFITKDPITGQVSYTRAGSFHPTNDGYIDTNYHAHLQGYQAVNGSIPQGGSVSDIKINNSSLPAKASTSIAINMHLDSNGTIPTGPFDPANTTTFNYPSKASVYDSLGNKHDVVSYYIKTANNSWTANVYVDGASVGTGTVTFNSDGSLGSVTGLSNLSFSPTNGAKSPQSFAIDMAGSTQTSGVNTVNSATADGYEPGNFTGASIDSNGMVWMQYSNSQKFLAGQIAIANFKAPQGLNDVGNMSWIATAESGSPIVNQANSVNNINVGALEQSNVDLTSEMVNLMNAQHAFQANAQVEQTYSEVMKTVIQL